MTAVEPASTRAETEPALIELERALRSAAKLLFSRTFTTHLPGGVRLDRAGYHCLVTLAEHGEQRLSDLAQTMLLDVSTVSRHVRSLEEAGLVGRRTDPDDGRAVQLALTDAGTDALRIQRDARCALLADATAGWTAVDRDTLRLLLGRLALPAPP